jgi:hypothetical protein
MNDSLTLVVPVGATGLPRGVFELGYWKNGLPAMLWLIFESMAFWQGGQSMSMAGVQGRSKVDALVGMCEGLGEFVEQAVRQGTSLREFEREILDRLLQMGHAATEQYLALQGNGDLGEVILDAEGRPLSRSDEPAQRPLRTIFGQHRFEAYVYRAGRHSHTPIVRRPVDERLGIEPDQWSPLLKEFTMLLSLQEAFEPAAQTFEALFRQRLSVDTLERVSQRMGTAAGEFLDNLEPPPAGDEGELLVLTADGKGVPLVHADAVKLRSFEEKPQRPGNRRMATLAAVYSVDRFRRTPEEIIAALFREALASERERRPEPRHKRVIARFPQVIEEIDDQEPIPGTTLALCWAAREVQQRRRPDQVLIRLMDGQHSLWDTAEACGDVPAEQVVDILDIVHVSHYVWRAAKAFHSHRERQEAFARERLLRILQGDAKGVITGLRRMATQHRLRGPQRREIDTVCGYFETHVERMKYDQCLAAGYPIATGVIEGACRHLVKDRLERSGMRWTLEGAQALLHLRALHQSSYWDQFHQQRNSKQSPATALTG